MSGPTEDEWFADEHTKGDWAVWHEAGVACIAIVHTGVLPVGSAKYNAYLMASAKKLQSALAELVYLKDHKPADYEARKPDAWRNAREALAYADPDHPNNRELYEGHTNT